jgi:hypothetical protein
MILNDEDRKYSDVIRTLNSLQQVKAPAGFEADLMRRINSGRFETKKTPLFKGFFNPQVLIPSSLAAAAVVLMLIMYIPSDDFENPLMIDPPVREDMITADQVTVNRSDPGSEIRRSGDSSLNIMGDRYIASASNRSLINKSGLNFRQINLSKEEREQLNRLKEKVRSFLSSQPQN